MKETGGLLGFGGNASISGTYYQTSGTVSIASGDTLTVLAAAQFGPYGTGEVDGPGTLSTKGTTTINEGVYLGGGLSWSNSGTVNDANNIAAGDTSGGTATLTNLAGASFNLTGDYLSIYNTTNTGNTSQPTGSLTFVNQGTLAKTSGNGTSHISTVITSTGTISSSSGTLELDGGGTFSGTLSGAGYVAFGGGTSTLGGMAGLSAANLLVDGGVVLFTGTQTAISGTYYQTNGTVSIASGDTLTVLAAAQFGPYGTGEIAGPGTLSTKGTTTINEGVYLGGGLSWSNSGTVNDANNIAGGDTNGGTATLTNLAGASFNLTGDYLNIYNTTNTGNAGQPTGSLTFVNHGTLAKTSGNGTSTISVALTNAADGVITSDSGTLALDGGTFSGSIGGASQVDFSGGTNTVTGSLTATNAFNQTGGVIAVSAGATLTLAGKAQFGPYGTGEVDGPGTLSTTGTTTINEGVYLGGGLSWSNSGTVNDANNIAAGDANGGTATLTNLAGASFNITSDYLSIYNTTNTGNASQPTGNLTLVNQGTLAKTGGSGTSTVSAALTNTGTVKSQNGTLRLTGSISNSGLIQGAQGGTVDLSGAIIGSGSLEIDNRGQIEIEGADTESVVFTGAGTLRLDAPTTFTGTIYGFNPGAEIVLGGAQAVSIGLQGTALSVGLAGGGSFNLSIAGLQSTGDLSLANNVLTDTAPLQAPMPDLVVTTIGAPATAVAGGSVSVTWNDVNQGNASAPGPWTDEVFLASDAAGDNPQLVGTLTFDGTLSQGQTLSRTLDVTLPAATAGNAYFLVKTDALSQVANDGTGPGRQSVTNAVVVSPAAVPTPPVSTPPVTTPPATTPPVLTSPVSTPPVSLSDITPDSGSNLGSVTLTLDGANFNANEQVAVVAPDGTTRQATQVRWVSGGKVWATFDLTGLATGAYTVQVNGTTGSATLPGAFTVNSGPADQLSVNLMLPPTTTQSTSGTGTITYTNTGDTDIAAPILDVSSTQALIQGPNDSTASGSSIVLGTNPNGPAGILQPGTQGSVSFTYTPTQPTAQGNISISVGTTELGATIDWSAYKNALQPATVDATDWNNVWTEFVNRVGTTTDSLTAALAQDATELSQVGQPTTDVSALLQYELFQASGALAGIYLTMATDIGSTSSSLSLSLDRYYDGTLLNRDATGAFGDGWTSTYDVTAITDASGNVYIQSPGVLHVFTLQPDGTYAAQAGDPARLTMSNSLLQMNDGTGDVKRFRSDGKLSSIMDGNGNAITLAYGGNGILQTVTSATTGEKITFTSDAAGQITSATDFDGRTVTYTYNATGTQLLSASGPDGTTTYAYATPTGSVQDNALISVTSPDGAQETFTYDAEGRLATQSGANGAGLETYSYANPGAVTVTDALGDPTTLLYNADGNIAQTQDALGNVTQLDSNAAGNLTSATTAGDSVYRYGYDAAGNLTSYTDPLGGTVNASYASGSQNLTSFTNQLGSQTHYTYDTAGDITGITYQDGSGDTYQYNTEGLLTQSTDADGNVVQYSYDSAGDLTGKTFADGTSDTYAYDAHGNLISATAQDGGTTRYTYDTADRLTSVANPQGQVESYTYNTSGKLATRTEPDGSVTQYSYDSYGRLTELQDGSGNLLDKYTYNTAGQLIRTDTGNGASTTYQYDVDGNVTEILNSNADGSVASRFDYTYNVDGQVVEDATSDGTWSYNYNVSGGLTHAVFLSINPAIQNQDISYVYDATGNRVSQTVNGAVTDYTTNALDQYTAVGGNTYTYDADGNMISETDNTGTTTFTYNKNGQLVSQSGSGGSYRYAYDALNNLVSVTQNGVTTTYIDDPLSLAVAGQPLTSIAQVYRSGGILSDTYDYGLGLAAVANPSGDVSYYDVDLTGNVTDISGPAGSLSSSYFYTPFGQATKTSGSPTGSFLYSGSVGDTTSGGLVEMRSRFYNPNLGRFISRDALGVYSGTNFYRYVENSPVDAVDPTGNIEVFGQLSVSRFFGAGGGGGVGIVVTFLNGNEEPFLILGFIVYLKSV